MNVVLCSDGSDYAREAVSFLKRVPLAGVRRVALLTVIPELGVLSLEENRFPDEIVQQAEELLSKEALRLAITDWSVQTCLRQGNVATEIMRAAKELAANYVVVGSHGLGAVERFLLGSVSDEVANRAACSVLVVRPAADAKHPGPLRVLLGYDGSENAGRCVDFVASLAEERKVSVRVVTVMPLITMFRMDILQKQSVLWKEEKEAASERLKRVCDRLSEHATEVSTSLNESSKESDELIRATEEFEADMIVVGATGRRGLERLALGSISGQVLHHAPCSVLVIR